MTTTLGERRRSGRVDAAPQRRLMGRLDVAKALVAGGADMNARNVLGQSAWNLAHEHELADVAAWLAGQEADRGAPRFPALTGAYLGQPPPGRTPTEFAAGIVGGHFNGHSSPAFSPDGGELYWSESIPPRGTGYGSGRTMMSRRAGDRWTYPARAMVGKVPLEDVPVITADGKHIYDMARRPIPGQAAGKENIWVADRVGDQWGDPRPLDAAVNALPHHWAFYLEVEKHTESPEGKNALRRVIAEEKQHWEELKKLAG